jgi:hypothetical protein
VEGVRKKHALLRKSEYVECASTLNPEGTDMQDRHKGRPETIGFTLSAAVPVEAVGFVLKAMFDAGCPPNGLDIKAIIDGGTNGHATAIDAPAARGLPRRPLQKHASNFRAEHIREAILAILSAQSSMQRKGLFAAVREKLGEAIHEARLSNVVSDFMNSGVISSDGKGLYSLTKSGKHELAHPAPTHITNADFAYSIIKAEPLRKFHLEEIEAAFEADGRAPTSAKSSVSHLAHKGVIKRLLPSTFMLAPGA